MEEKKTVEIEFKIGNDNGNSEQDMVIDGVSIEQPNVMCKIRKLPVLDEVNPNYVAENIHDNLIVTLSDDVPGKYYVGKYALGSGEKIHNIEVGADNSKVDSDLILINTLAHVAGEGVKRAYNQKEDLKGIEILVKADMTTALPVTQYSKKTATEFADRFMKTKYTVIVHVATIEIKVHINFMYTKTLPESVPTIFELQSMKLIKKTPEEMKKLSEDEKKAINVHNAEVMELFAQLNEQKEEKNKTLIDGNFFINKKVLHTGIGEGTTEYPLTKDRVFDPRFIKGSNNGIGHAIDNALEEFKEEWGLLNYSRQKYSEVLRNPAHKYYDTAFEIVQDYIEDQSEEILRHIKTEIERANNEVDILCVYGGGSILMKDHLEKKLKDICSKANITLFYVPAKYAVTLEGKGMYKFTISDIFKMLKEKHQQKSI